MRFNFISVSLLLIAFSTPFETSAAPISKKVSSQSKDTRIVIQSMRHGDTWNNTSRFYSSANQTLTVRGRLIKVPAFIPDTDLKLVVSGTDIVTLPGSAFSTVRTGTPQKFVRGQFMVRLPAPGKLPWPLTDVVVELVYKPSNQVLARSRVSLYDFRSRTATATADPTAPLVGMVAQLTNKGLGDLSPATDEVAGLEIPVLSSLPSPSLPDFNQRLTLAALALNRAVLEGPLNDCIDLNDSALVDDNFRSLFNFPAYGEARLEAEELYQIYLQIQNGTTTCAAAFGVGALICQLGIQNYCVKSPPSVGDFELCVNKIEGDATSLTIDDVSDYSMRFIDSGSSTEGAIDANIEIRGVDGRVDGFLRDLVVRWKNPTCLLRPSAEMSNEGITDRPWLNTWATCEDLEIGSLGATTSSSPTHSARFSVNKDAQDSNNLDVTDTRGAKFTPVTLFSDAAKQTCSLSFINDSAEEMLSDFFSPLFSTLNTTWNEGLPRSRLARTLDDLFEPFGLGDSAFTNHILAARIDSVRSSREAGLVVTWENLAEPELEDDYQRLNRGMFGQGGGAQVQSTEAVDHLGEQFDGSFSAYNGLVNRVLWARAATDSLNGPLTFTWAELSNSLGISIPLDQLPFSNAKITGEILSNLHPAFRQFRSDTFQILLERSIDPLVYMPEDPSALIPQVGFPLYYGVQSLRVIFKTLEGGPGNKGREVVSFSFSGYDDSFNFSFSNSSEAEFLQSSFVNPAWTLFVDDSALVRCPMFTSQRGVPQTRACERRLESAVFLFLRDKIQARLDQIVDEIPAPQFYRVKPDGDQVGTEGTSTLQIPSHVQLFGQYTPVP